jgi:hypothetical protein
MKVGIIADDLSGAAELAGAAADMGYSAEVHTSFDPASSAEVIALDTDSRAIPADAAAKVVVAATRALLSADTGWIYKKSDSVFRGNVRAEIEAVLDVSGSRHALLVPANPSIGRIIRGGVYYVNGRPLSDTAFAADPDHPRRSSAVLELLYDAGAVGGNDSRIVVPDVEDSAGVLRIAGDLDGRTLPAGGVEFFRAVLEQREGKRSSTSATLSIGRPALLVCGSAHAWGRGRAAQCELRRVPVLVMPESVRSAVAPPWDAMHAWAHHIGSAFTRRGCAAVAIGGHAIQGAPSRSAILSDRLAEAVAAALRVSPVSSLCVEGGATAAALLRRCGWTCLAALPSSGFEGVAALRPTGRAGPLVLVKPGSYPWPEQIWQQLAREDGR